MDELVNKFSMPGELVVALFPCAFAAVKACFNFHGDVVS